MQLKKLALFLCYFSQFNLLLAQEEIRKAKPRIEMSGLTATAINSAMRFDAEMEELFRSTAADKGARVIHPLKDSLKLSKERLQRQRDNAEKKAVLAQEMDQLLADETVAAFGASACVDNTYQSSYTLKDSLELARPKWDKLNILSTQTEGLEEVGLRASSPDSGYISSCSSDECLDDYAKELAKRKALFQKAARSIDKDRASRRRAQQVKAASTSDTGLALGAGVAVPAALRPYMEGAGSDTDYALLLSAVQAVRLEKTDKS